jgi:hypothetical protein
MKPGQFSLRQLLGVMLVCATGLAILTPAVHNLTRAQALILAAELCIALGSFALIRFFLRYYGRRLEAKAGELLLHAIAPRRMNILIVSTITACFILFEAYSVAFRPNQQWSAFDVMQPATFGLTAGLWWSLKRLDICANGLIVGGEFFAWNEIRSCSWGVLRNPPTLILTVPRVRSASAANSLSRRIDQRLPLANRDWVDALLAEHGVPRLAGPLGSPSRIQTAGRDHV